MNQVAFGSGTPPKNCPASAITWQCGAEDRSVQVDDRKWLNRIYQQLPKHFSIRIARNYKLIFEQQGRFAANSYTREIEQLINQIDFRFAGNEYAIDHHAKNIVERCRIYRDSSQFKRNRISSLKDIVESEGIQFPNHSEIGIVNRLCDCNWWRRNLRKKHNRGLEKIALKLNLINKRDSIYISNENLFSFRQQKARNKTLLQKMSATNELNQEFTLDELAETSVSNPKNRRAELMVRIAGTEKYAKNLGHIAIFYTITCPSRMHSSLSKNIVPNPKYDGTTPREAQAHLCDLWACIRSKFKRENLLFYGVRVAEPHCDGTTHWHLLLFMRPEDENTISSIIRAYALQDSPDEPGAKNHRFTAKPIEASQGSAIAYIAKYVSKNIDGFGLKEDEHGNSSENSVERVQAWASLHGIRQFQFFGGPPVGVWRELRRLDTCDLPANVIKEAAIHAQNSNWAEYISIMKGIECARSKLPITILKAWSDRDGKYGEPLGNVVKGLEFDGVSYPTRIHTWTITRKFETSERAFTRGSGGVVNEVKRPLPGDSRAGVASFSHVPPVPNIKVARPLDLYQ